MFEFSPVCKQFLVIICCNFLVFSFGLTSGWTIINLNEFQNANSTLPMGKLSTGEGSLVVSLLFAGGFVGNFIIIPVSNYIGIKKTIHMFGVLLITSSVLILYTRNAYWLYISRFMCGLIGGGLVVGIPTFINEISNDNVRAALNSFYDIANNLGTIISFLLGNFLNWSDQAKCQLILPIIFLCVMFLYPESPEHWIKLRKEKQAIRSCRFYKGNICAIENVQFISKHQCIDAEYEQTIVRHNKNDTKLTFQDFLTPKAKRSIFIGFVSLIISFLSCATVMLSYITSIFEVTGSPFSTKYSSFLISLVQLFANIIFLNIVERFKRTTLYIFSSVLTAMAYVAYGIYCWGWLKQSEYEYVSFVCFAFIIFVSSMGLVPIPYILCVEIFPKKIRKTCLTLAVSMMWIVLFGLDAAFPAFLKYVPLHFCMFVLAIMTLINTIFGIIFIPETRGKSYEEIMQLLDR